ncbi:3-oxoadipate enol-lactonase 2 [Variovorax sp. PBL-H6]|uniref:alpha/beta fold hydrolase n=1 Tax=Variovorax sp. PBL-H6 TaxID=434009 RepID=UPI00131940D0|nr:alpha/beta fold hydrolase [Variovorax sp. PBL-H6]VTU15095.1 3-oxoadipate enol-lactonase 2 [Variovorax sp. PBL-H6]
MAGFRFIEHGDRHLPVLLLANSLCANDSMWDAQVEAWSKHRRILRFNYAGHGPYGVPVAYTDAAPLAEFLMKALDDAEVHEFDFVGLSLGGMLGLAIAGVAAGRLRGMVVANGRIHQTDQGRALWAERIAKVRAHGVASIVDETIDRWFTAQFLERRPSAIERTRSMMRGVSAAGYCAAAEIVRSFDGRSNLNKLPARTLFLAAAQDTAAPAAHLEEFARFAGSEFVCLADCAHLANVECPAEFNRTVSDFLAQRPV